MDIEKNTYESRTWGAAANGRPLPLAGEVSETNRIILEFESFLETEEVGLSADENPAIQALIERCKELTTAVQLSEARYQDCQSRLVDEIHKSNEALRIAVTEGRIEVAETKALVFENAMRIVFGNSIIRESTLVERNQRGEVVREVRASRQEAELPQRSDAIPAGASEGTANISQLGKDANPRRMVGSDRPLVDD